MFSTLGLVAFAATADRPARTAEAATEAPTPNRREPVTELLYRGHAKDRSGTPLRGRFDITARYLVEEKTLFLEAWRSVEISSGRFELPLGTGESVSRPISRSISTLGALFARHPDVDLELTIGGVRQAPRVRILPAGHSQESRAILAGEASAGDGRPHTEGWRYRPAMSAVEAVVLRPASGPPERAASSRRGPFEIAMRGPWRSPPLRTLAPRRTGTATAEVPDDPEEINPLRHEEPFDLDGSRIGTAVDPVADTLVAAARAPALLQTPTPFLDFAGIGNLTSRLPPDPNGAVGPEHFVQLVNMNFQVFDKSGVSAGGPYPTSVLWTGYGGPCENDNSGDAIVLYDRYASRWLLAQFAIASGDERVCFALSLDDDPLGSYELYELVTQRFPDYFKLGVWPDPANDAYLMATNSGFQNGYDVYALDRASMVAGVPARPSIFFQSYPNLLLPADANGPRLPPPGSPGLLYTFRDAGQAYFGSPAADSLDLYEFHVDWTTPASSTLTKVVSFTNAVGGFADFNWTVCGFFQFNCLPQPGTAQKLDSSSYWPMHRFQYRRFEDHESLVGSWTVDATGSPDLAAPRWFELRRSGGGWSIFQQGTHAPDGAHRWEPSIAMDGDGNLALGYSAVDAPNTVYPSIRYAMRASGDALATLRAEQTLIAGSGSQTHTAARWGDYSSMSVDPVDDCTFWYTNEYLETTDLSPWLTRIGAFRYPGCGGLAVTPTVRAACGTDGETTFAVALSSKFDSHTNLSVSGCPAGATCSFDPDPVTSPPASSELTISNLGGVASGPHRLEVTAEELGPSTDSFTTGVVLDLRGALPTTPSPTAPANASAAVSLRPTFTWSAASEATSYTLEVARDVAFTDVVYQASELGTSHVARADLPSRSTLFWRVIAENACGTSVLPPIFWFETAVLPGDCPAGQIATNIFAEEFESGAPGWSSSGSGDTWSQSAARKQSGSFSWRATAPKTVTEQNLVSPAIALPASGAPLTLSFWSHRMIQEPGFCWDGALLEISIDDGGSWTQIGPELLSDPYDGAITGATGNPLAGLQGWCGHLAWHRTAVDLSSRAGLEIRLRYRLGTDSSASDEGFWLDDVSVDSCAVDPAIFDDGFETGNRSRWSASVP